MYVILFIQYFNVRLRFCDQEFTLEKSEALGKSEILYGRAKSVTINEPSILFFNFILTSDENLVTYIQSSLLSRLYTAIFIGVDTARTYRIRSVKFRIWSLSLSLTNGRSFAIILSPACSDGT